MLVNYLKHRPTNFDKFFDDFTTRDFFRDFEGLKKLSSPKVNISETKNEYLVYLKAVGFQKEEFSIEIDKNLLKISGIVKKKEEERKETFTHKEFSVNPFSKTFTLPEHVNAELIAADYEGGILKLTLPKLEKQEKQVKTINVK